MSALLPAAFAITFKPGGMLVAKHRVALRSLVVDGEEVRAIPPQHRSNFGN